MAKTNFTSVDDYIDSQPEAVRPVLERVRGAIRKALPRAEEFISYQIPAYILDGDRVIFFAGWKTHYSIYPAGKALIAEFKSELEPYEIKGNTIRFPIAQPVPVRLIGRIAKFRAQEAKARRR